MIMPSSDVLPGFTMFTLMLESEMV
jgi:hypothetical protein